ncbi:hypothetical protein DFJ58DRAFT_843993 [Suillus subalutaceus]|uniref:uncharacterized protein n=1 Tax=Suillus subalutaceus TaxID=48586 RepID=UPI001B873797|nr:uncharacterized protein DFJ58DRAFT_843993 [Suillus subalutaceus]KAG1844672.1 hypothetical protein DFJ58DRAFT_843993 [Suillus subalutaceus]
MGDADADADAEGELDEEEVDVRPLLVTKHAATVGAVAGRRKPLKTPRAVVPVVHPVPCARCVKAKKPCVGKPGNSCELCKDACKKCEYSTHRHGVAKERAAACAVAAKAAVKGPLLPLQVPLRGGEGSSTQLRVQLI